MHTFAPGVKGKILQKGLIFKKSGNENKRFDFCCPVCFCNVILLG
jgi:hypothetical protein